MRGLVYRRVNAYWHHLRTPAGMYFATSRAEVFRKAGLPEPVSGGHRLAAQVSDRQRDLQEFIRQEQAAALRASEAQRGARHVLS